MFQAKALCLELVCRWAFTQNSKSVLFTVTSCEVIQNTKSGGFLESRKWDPESKYLIPESEISNRRNTESM